MASIVGASNISFSSAKSFAELQGYAISDKAKTKDDILDELFDYDDDFGQQPDPSDPVGWSHAIDSLPSGLPSGEHVDEPGNPNSYDPETDPNEPGEPGGYGGGGEGGGGDEGAGKPVILDLDGDGVEYIERSVSTVFFDINGDGYRNHMGWVSGDDGFLAYDKNGDGRITDSDEISFIGYVAGALTDVEGLRYFDTDGDGRLTSADAEWSKFGVWRDLDGDGYRNHLGWVSGDDGFLAYDKDGDGRITEYDEISFTGYVEGARTDVEGLRHFDTNGDGRLTSADAEWSSFGVWRDLDSDGEFDAGEFQTLTEAGISSITLSTDGNQREVSGHTVFGSGTYTTDSGATHSFDD